MAGTLMPVPRYQFLDDSGVPLAGGKVYFYIAGTSTPQNTYSDAALTTPNANPLILDAAGRGTIYLSAASYKVVVKTSADVTVWTQDNVSATGLTAASSVLNNICDGRLTLTTATPVTTADVTAATTVFWTPYKGSRISLYDGSSWGIYAFSELSIALGADAASKNYDVFAVQTAGVVSIERLVWTSDTARATALVVQDGVLVKSGDTTRRYLGTYRTTVTIGQTEDSRTKRFLWNYYNRVVRSFERADTTPTWTYSTATYRQANNAAANKIEVVNGWIEETISLRLHGAFENGAAGVSAGVAISADSVTAAFASSILQDAESSAAGARTGVSSSLNFIMGVGYHYFAWLEISDATPTTTWYGTSGSAMRAGLTGNWRA